MEGMAGFLERVALTLGRIGRACLSSVWGGSHALTDQRSIRLAPRYTSRFASHIRSSHLCFATSMHDVLLTSHVSPGLCAICGTMILDTSRTSFPSSRGCVSLELT